MRICNIHSIICKYIKRGKKVIEYVNQYCFIFLSDRHHAVKSAKMSSKKLVQVDDAVFTFSTSMWSAKYSRIELFG
jgi:ferredoxin-thioredoxin reductase catalytic subunit